MLLYIRKLALIQRDDPNNSGDDTFVILSNIDEGIDGASTFGLTVEPSELTIEAGNTYVDSVNITLDVRVLKPTGNAYTGQTNIQQLKDWSDNQTDLYVSALTLDGGLFFGDYQTQTGTVKMALNEQISDNDVLAFKITLTSTVGFNPDTGAYQGLFWAGKNLTGIYEWGDADGSGLADGWNTSSELNDSFSNGQQSIEAGTSLAFFNKEIYFPFEGETVTWSINYVSISGDTPNIERLLIRGSDSSGSQVSSTNQDLAGTGRSSLSYTIPSSVITIKPEFAINATSTTVTAVVEDPMLSIDGSTTYTKF